jgi:hypothetical protein
MQTMTIGTVAAEVQRIAAMAGDDEGAHIAEDGLHQSVLAYIAEHGDAHSAALARAALATTDIEFARWCA